MQGQLGVKSSQYTIDHPQQVPFFEGRKLEMVACGQNHTLFLSDEKVYACGSNYFSQIGNQQGASGLRTPARVHLPGYISWIAAWNCSSAVTIDGKLFQWG